MLNEAKYLLVTHLKVDGIAHSERVAALVGETETVPALLHDIVEDSPVTLEMIQAQFGIDVRRVVDALTRRPHETYTEYIDRVALDPTAKRIKVADLQDHFNQAETLPLSLRRRYEKAVAQLNKETKNE